MTTREAIRGHWNQLRGRIEERWTQLSPHDLDNVQGDTDQLVGTIQQKTGQARQKIEAELDALLQDISTGTANAAETMGDYAKQAQAQAAQYAEAARQQYDHMNEMVRDGYHQAEAAVRSRPAESIAIAFGTGILTGLVAGLILNKR